MKILDFLRNLTQRRQQPVTAFTLIRTDLGDEIALHRGDFINVEKAFVGFDVEAAVIRNRTFQTLPIAHCDSLREAEFLKGFIDGAIARHDAKFDARARNKSRKTEAKADGI